MVTPDASQLDPLGGTLSLSIPTQTEPKIHSKPTWYFPGGKAVFPIDKFRYQLNEMVKSEVCLTTLKSSSNKYIFIVLPALGFVVEL